MDRMAQNPETRPAYAYSTDGTIVAHRICNMASVFTAELVALATGKKS